MCELFGFSSSKKIKCNELLREFYSHGGDNPHGWGLATFYGNSVCLEKEPASSLTSMYLMNRLTDDIEEKRLLAHIRKASKGGIEYKNTHPFAMRDGSGRLWTLEHNGTVFESSELDSYFERQKGSTDSERILYDLIDRVNAKLSVLGGDLTEEDRFLAVDETVRAVTPKNKVNLLIYDGDLFYVHTNFKDTLHWQRTEQTLLVSTKPLKEGAWEKVPLNTLFAFRDGALVHTGSPHQNEYVSDEQTTSDLSLDYSNL